MGDTGAVAVSPDRKSPAMPRLAVYALVVCLLAVAAAVVSFVEGSVLIGIVWVLLAGLSSNMTWYYMKRGRASAATPTTD